MSPLCPDGHEMVLEGTGQFGKTNTVSFHDDGKGGLCKWSGGPLPPKGSNTQRIVVPPGKFYTAEGKRWLNKTSEAIVIEFNPDWSG